MKYIAIFDIPDDCAMGCASAYIAPKGKEIYKQEDFKDVYAQIEPLAEEKAEIFEKFNAVLQIMQNLSLSNAYDMPSFWCNNKKDYKVIPTKYHRGYMQALEDVEREVRLRLGFAERNNILDIPALELYSVGGVEK